MAIRTVVTRGYGAGATIGLVTTRGYGTAGEIPPEPTPVTTRQVDVGGGMPQYRRGERRKRGLEWDKKKDDLAERIEAIYARLYGELAGAVNEKGTVREAVAPFAAPSDTPIPPPAAVNFTALKSDLMRMEILLQQYEAAVLRKAEIEDEDDMIEALLLS
jgi:hypothetical protein